MAYWHYSMGIIRQQKPAQEPYKHLPTQAPQTEGGGAGKPLSGQHGLSGQLPGADPHQIENNAAYQVRNEKSNMQISQKSAHGSYTPDTRENRENIHEYGDQVKIVSRANVKSSVTYERIKNLASAKAEAEGRRQKTEINREIRERVGRLYEFSSCGFDKIHDLRGNPVSEFFKSENAGESPPYDFPLADESYVRGFQFDFVEDNKSHTKGDICIRTTALLTDDGKKKAERYVMKWVRSPSLKAYSNKTKYRISRAEAKRTMRYKRAYDINIGDASFHINLNGKVEVFAAYPRELRPLLTGLNESGKSRQKLEEYAKFSKLKKWIGVTSPEANFFVAETFRSLAAALDEIFG